MARLPVGEYAPSSNEEAQSRVYDDMRRIHGDEMAGRRQLLRDSARRLKMYRLYHVTRPGSI